MATATTLEPLREGELLDQAEFQERYFAMPEEFRAELIEGKVSIMSPVYGGHSDVHPLILTCLTLYAEATPGAWCRSDGTTILDGKNQLQPDAALFVLPSHGGSVRFDSRECLVGAPELVVEVADASEARDSRTKQRIYESVGVKEYIVVLLRSRAIRWLVRGDGKFSQLDPENGLIKSRAFPGLWLDSQAILDRQVQAVLKTLRRGLADPAHAEFVEELAARAIPPA